MSARIDELIRAKWAAERITPALPADDAEFFRRLSLDLNGRIPTITQLKDFLDDTHPDKKRIWTRLLMGEAVSVDITKRFSFGPAPNGCEISCEVGLKVKQPVDRAVMVGIETIINLLAPTESDRFIESAAGPQGLRFSGELPAPILHMQDDWQKLRITLHAHLFYQVSAPIKLYSPQHSSHAAVVHAHARCRARSDDFAS